MHQQTEANEVERKVSLMFASAALFKDSAGFFAEVDSSSVILKLMIKHALRGC